MRRWGIIAAAALLALTLGGGGRGAGGESERVELVVSAAASLTDSLTELQALYAEERPGVRIAYNFGASGALQRQIEQGAPVDLFLSAGVPQMEALVAQGLVSGDRAEALLSNELVAVAKAATAETLTSPVRMLDDAVRVVAVGEPETVPAGTYAKAYLTAAGLWETLEPKLVFAKDVRQVLSYVETGNAEIGFVYRTDAATSTRVRIAFAADPALVPPITYPAAVLRSSASPEEAERFLAFLRGERAAAVFAKYGFGAAERGAAE